MKAKNYCPEFKEYKTIHQWVLLLGDCYATLFVYHKILSGE